MRTYEEMQAQRAEFEQAVMDARAREAATVCPLTRDTCAGRFCACAHRVTLGWICGLTNGTTSGRRARVVDVDTTAMLKDANKLTAQTYIRKGVAYA